MTPMTSPALGYSDLRGWLHEAERIGKLKHVAGAHWDKEIGCISELMAERDTSALLFDEIPGYPKGFRVLSNAFIDLKTTALVLGAAVDSSRIEMVDAWRQRLKAATPLCSVDVGAGPVTEYVLTGSEADLLRFPAPLWHEKDAGRFLGTGCAVVTKDLDDGWVNVGTYRCRVVDHDRITVAANPGKHGTEMMKKYHAEGRPFPVAIVCGMDPLVFLAAGHPYTGAGECAYDFAGGLRGSPIEVVEGATTGLPVPASAELVIEGEMPPPPKLEMVEDGPFGEWKRSYSSGVHPVMEVKSIMHREDPIILGVAPLKAHIPFPFSIPLMASEVWNVLEHAGIPGVTGVWFGLGLIWPVFLVIRVKQSYAGQAKQAALAAASCRANTVGGMYVIVVDDDVDITNEKDVLLAVAGRATVEDIQVIHGMITKAPMGPGSRRHRAAGENRQLLSSRVLIDACWPFARRDEFPRSTAFDQAYARQVLEKWPIAA